MIPLTRSMISRIEMLAWLHTTPNDRHCDGNHANPGTFADRCLWIWADNGLYGFMKPAEANLVIRTAA